MENTTYIGLSYQAGLERQMAVLANNVANVSTPGFKSREILFKEYLAAPSGEANPYNQVTDYTEYMDTAPGNLSQTGRPLDVALEGSGFLGVITPDGVRFTRAGQFTLNAAGEIVAPGGLRVADDGGAPITIPAGAKEIKITTDGTVNVDGNAVGQLLVREFANPQGLIPEGNNLFDNVDQTPLPPIETTVRQGMIEGSNVNGVSESTKMIEVMRDFQSVQRLLQSENERIRGSIQRLSGRGN